MRRLIRAAGLLAAAALLLACAWATAPSARPAGGLASEPAGTPGPSATVPPEPTPSPEPEGEALEDVPTACVGLGEGDCRRVVAHLAGLLTPDDPQIGYIQVGPFGCADAEGCPATLAGRPEGDVALEFAGGALSFHVKVTGDNLDAQRQETFGVELAPSSDPPPLAGPQPYTLGHCGLWSGIDVGGSWWDPVGVVDYDHGDAINAAEGTIAPLGPDRALFTSRNGFTVQLVRRNGQKFLPLCD